MTKKTLLALISGAVIIGLGCLIWVAQVAAQKPDLGLAELAHQAVQGANFRVPLWHESPVSRDDSSHPLGGSNDFLGNDRAEPTAFVYEYTEAYALDGVVEASDSAGYGGKFLYRYHDKAAAAKAAQEVVNALVKMPNAKDVSALNNGQGRKANEASKRGVPFWSTIMALGSEGTVLYCRVEAQNDVLSLLIVEGADQRTSLSVFESLVAREMGR